MPRKTAGNGPKFSVYGGGGTVGVEAENGNRGAFLVFSGRLAIINERWYE